MQYDPYAHAGTIKSSSYQETIRLFKIFWNKEGRKYSIKLWFEIIYLINVNSNLPIDLISIFQTKEHTCQITHYSCSSWWRSCLHSILRRSHKIWFMTDSEILSRPDSNQVIAFIFAIFMIFFQESGQIQYSLFT